MNIKYLPIATSSDFTLRRAKFHPNMLQALPSRLKTFYKSPTTEDLVQSQRLTSLRDGINRYISALNVNISQVEVVNKEYLVASPDSEAKRTAKEKFITETQRFQNDFRWFIDYLKSEMAFNDPHQRQSPAEWFYSKTLPPERFSMKQARTSRSLMSPLVDYESTELDQHSVESLAVAVRMVYLSTRHLADRAWDEAFLTCRRCSQESHHIDSQGY